MDGHSPYRSIERNFMHAAKALYRMRSWLRTRGALDSDPAPAPGSVPDSLQVWGSRNRGEFFDAYSRFAPFFATLPEIALQHAEHGTIKAFCFCCNRPAAFELPSLKFPGAGVSWREEVLCPRCRLNSRMRFAMTVLRGRLAPSAGARLYVTEQATPAYAWLRRNYPETTGSEFYIDQGTGERLQVYLRNLTGDATLALRCEDVTALSFPSGSMTLVLSFDVLEHVPDYSNALAEFARILAPVGRLLLSVPFIPSSDTTLVRARLRADGTVEHLLPPEYHGDPTNETGCLCYYHFGWDLLPALLHAGFRDAYALSGFSAELGHFAPEIVFIAER